MNDVKLLIQKEEYISLALNKYILQTGTIPKNVESLDWTKLMVDDYLGVDFNKKNPITSNDIVVTFDANNNAYIKGAIETEVNYKDEYKYLYNFYVNKVFRVNTIPPKNTLKSELVKGTQVLYNDVQKEIALLRKDSANLLLLPNQNCTSEKYFYELRNEKLTYKYCKTDGTSLTIYQESPIYVEDWNDLQYIRANIGASAYVQKNGEWFEYYYQGNLGIPWIPIGEGEKLASQQEEEIVYAEKISSYIPNAKDLFIRQSGGCMLASGDIFCWGNNDYKKAGISSYGQLDTTLSPSYINTPVMLKTQIDNIKIGTTTYDLNGIKWYNNPYRVKFDKMAMNRSNVCAITKIFEYVEGTDTYKFGGDLYCDGNITSRYYEDLSSTAVESNILKRNISIYTGKSSKIKNSNAIYLKDIAMIEDVTALLSDNGKIYVIGKNYKGSLGIDSSDYFYFVYSPTLVSVNSDIVFKKIFALRDSRTFGAIDSNNIFYIWGERGDSVITKPTAIANSKQFNPDAIFVNTNEFVLKGIDGTYYKTKGNLEIESINSSLEGTPISLSYYKDNKNNEYLLYIDENLKLKGSSTLLSCKESNETSLCDNNSNEIFDSSINYLNTANNEISNKLANFTNVSIFKLDHEIEEIINDFEDDTVGWNRTNSYNGGTDATTFLGRFASSSSSVDYLNKTFDLGSENANKSINITFNFYEIDSWDDEYFRVYINGVKKFEKKYKLNRNDGGTSLIVDGSGWSGNEEKHEISIDTTLDSNGRVRLGFSSTLNDGVSNESWGVDNIKISRSDGKILSFSNFENDASTWTLKTYTARRNFNPGNLISTGIPPTTTATETTADTSKLPITERVDPTRILGRLLLGQESIEKTYDFGTSYANYEVEVELDFYEIDSWDMERFQVFLNSELVAEDGFIHDCHDAVRDTNDSGVYTLNLGKSYNQDVSTCNQTGQKYSKNNDEKYVYKLRTKLDNNGKLHILMRVRDLVAGEYGALSDSNGNIWYYGQSLDDESWGIDNVKVKLKETYKKFVCAMTGIEDASQMYCWGNVARSVPILSTSLYDVDKISSINKLFITQDGEKSNQLSFDEYYNDGKLFLKYPTYIGGFNYPFYFR
ncbi:MAG: hypothetical protein PHY66_00635 [Aliarcobacter sp.]|nr:hypothetical protein [Aliarcobacter sp.]